MHLLNTHIRLDQISVGKGNMFLIFFSECIIKTPNKILKTKQNIIQINTLKELLHICHIIYLNEILTFHKAKYKNKFVSQEM